MDIEGKECSMSLVLNDLYKEVGMRPKEKSICLFSYIFDLKLLPLLNK